MDRSTVKNLIGRSQSIKIVPRVEGSSTDVRRAISFKQRSVEGSSSQVSLQKAAEFRQTSQDESSPPHSPKTVQDLVSSLSELVDATASQSSEPRQDMVLPLAEPFTEALSHSPEPFTETLSRSPEPVVETVSPPQEAAAEEEEFAPQLPHAPPPVSIEAPMPSMPGPLSPSFSMKGNLSPPLSPTQKRTELVL